ncbi:unnamed protein product [Phytophthora fragariaefolia]|uniref:Unnamed protein product n=1 Tax=Phytophthora fragariaefolia TaxID=1490495 RepID=A0A9W6XHH6_9STRA|nr:unnamed protein product [Phytophthora fragariaefolia]
MHTNTMEEAIQNALQEENSHRQARTPATAWQGNSASGSAQGGSPGNGATSGPVPMERGLADNANKSADALWENSGAGPVSVRLANGSLVEVSRVLVGLSVKFEDFDSTERFIVLEMDKYDLILGMPWLEKDEPWIDWRGKAIGASRPALSDRALVSHVPTSSKSKGVRQDRQGASAPEAFVGVAEAFGVPQEVTVDSVKESAEAPPGVRPSDLERLHGRVGLHALRVGLLSQ